MPTTYKPLNKVCAYTLNTHMKKMNYNHYTLYECYCIHYFLNKLEVFETF